MMPKNIREVKYSTNNNMSSYVCLFVPRRIQFIIFVLVNTW